MQKIHYSYWVSFFIMFTFWFSNFMIPNPYDLQAANEIDPMIEKIFGATLALSFAPLCYILTTFTLKGEMEKADISKSLQCVYLLAFVFFFLILLYGVSLGPSRNNQNFTETLDSVGLGCLAVSCFIAFSTKVKIILKNWNTPQETTEI